MKNIVVCCDGTRAEYGESNDNTNVVRLFERLGSDGEGQVSYYDPGVGTYSPLRGPIRRGLDKLAMAISGSGVDTNVQEAYRYLMDNYQQGDRLYLFGYSRGCAHGPGAGRYVAQVRSAYQGEPQPHTVRGQSLQREGRRDSP